MKPRLKFDGIEVYGENATAALEDLKNTYSRARGAIFGGEGHRTDAAAFAYAAGLLDGAATRLLALVTEVEENGPRP